MSDLAIAPPSVSAPVHADIARVFALQERHQYAVARSGARERIEKIRRLHDAMLRHREAVEAALWQDLRKSKTEVAISELGVVCGEARHAMRHLRAWMRSKPVGTPMTIFGSASEIRYEPKGLSLILAPWNFPFNLTFAPLVSAIAAGNCAILKPSEYTPHSAAVMRSIIAECFPEEEICLFEGDASVAQALLEKPFNHVFFTGSPQIGKVVMGAAARHLASVTLELGGKSPVVVDDSADVALAASRVAWLKCMNAGQICTAPDYVLVQERLHDAFVAKVAENIRQYYGDTLEARLQSPDLCRIVHERHFDRVKALLDDAVQRGAKVAHGGQALRAERFIDPAILTDVPEGANIWSEEIFGSLLPVRPYRELSDAIAYINTQPKPLALYIFSNNRRQTEAILRDTRCGGVTINDCSTHFYNAELPFGGSNNSGIGKCHGAFGFQEFSNAKGVLRQTRFLPTTQFMLPPYGSKLAKWMLEGVVRWF